MQSLVAFNSVSLRRIFNAIWIALITAAGVLTQPAAAKPTAPDHQGAYDVVVYGGTSAGIAAAVQVARMGKTALIIEPTQRLGGLTTGGLGQTDIGNKAAIGGVSREFYQNIRKYYNNPQSWRWQEPDQYRSGGQSRTGAGEDAMWTFEPSAALAIYQEMIAKHKIPVVYNERLDLTAGVAATRSIPPRIIAIRMESGRTYQGRMFIDATYEGDLMAKAGVPYTVGREANAKYGETLNGVQTRMAKHHQLKRGVDPYIKPGDPDSGLLPGIDPAGPGEEGGADRRVQGYCFRMCLTDHPENRIPFAKPEDYDPLRYELLLRNYEAGERAVPWINSRMPNRKTDTNNRTGFSTDFIGQNYDYPEADYAAREKIIQAHRTYQQGLMWTLANHPRVPESVRKEVSRWGTCKDEFERTDGWQQQLYIREARRMVSDYVMTQHNCQGRVTAEDAVGLAAYTMDSHNVQRYVTEKGDVQNEGDVQVGGFSPYPISYRSIIPPKQHASNLFVPVCLSASHIAFGSIRMEPVFMVLAQSAATAACQAIDDNVTVHDVNYQKLRDRLLEDGQILEWKGPRRGSPSGPGHVTIDPAKLPGIVVDNPQAKTVGQWTTSSSTHGYVGSSYYHDGDIDKGQKSVIFTLKVAKPGQYELRLAYTAHVNRATNAPVTITVPGQQPRTLAVNQRRQPSIEGTWISLGKVELSKNSQLTVTIGNTATNGYVIADAVQAMLTKGKPQ